MGEFSLSASVALPVSPRAMAFDLDGTILDYSGALREPVSATIRKIVASGIKVFVVTGRIQAGCEAHWRSLGLSTPVATCNGAHIGFPGERPFFHRRLAREAVTAMAAMSLSTGRHVNYYIDNRVYVTADTREIREYAELYRADYRVVTPDELADMPLPTKALCITGANCSGGVSRELALSLKGRAQVTESNRAFIEILPLGVDKGSALRLMAEREAIPPGEWLAAGDELNDIPMLRAAGCALTFSTANPALRPQAHIVTPPLWDGGAACLLEQVLGLPA